MTKEKAIEVEGEVIESLPNAMFRVKLKQGHVILAHVRGKMRMHFIKILPGDRVRVEISLIASIEGELYIDLSRRN